MLSRASRLITINTLKLQQSSRTLVTRRTFRSKNASTPAATAFATTVSTSQDQSKDKKSTWSDYATKQLYSVLKVGAVVVIVLYIYEQKDNVSQLGEFFGLAPRSDLKVVSLSEKYDSYADAILTHEHGKKAIAEYRAARKLPKLVGI